MIYKLWIGYGGDDGMEDYHCEIFKNIKYCAVNAFLQQHSTDEPNSSLCDILKSLKETGYFFNPHANNGYGWEYKLYEFNTDNYDEGFDTKFTESDIDEDILDDDLETFNNM